MECEQADRLRARIWQGDVIAAHPGTTNWNDPFRRFFVVVSADCDIANNKLETGLVVVPVIGLHTYATAIWVPSQMSSLRALIKKKGGNYLAGLGLGHLTAEQFLATSDDGVLGRVATLSESEDAALKKTARALQALRTSNAELETASAEFASAAPFAPAMTKMAKVKADVTGSPCPPEKELEAGVATVGDPKRVDLWPILDLIGLDSDMREDENHGFVALLRHFGRLVPTSVHIDRQSWLSDAESYFRICRLRGIYKTDFLQRFANLFVRVGLDASREAEHKQGFARAAKNLLRTNE